MSQWIANLFSGAKPTTDEPSVMQTFIGQNLKLDLKERCLPCGHITYLVELDWYCPSERDWLPVALLTQSDLADAIELLQKAKMFIDAL